ncbi:MAG: Na+/H+ antiporter NhaC family protein [Spirochaetales bacterium]|nr:Na+/H+ antiporter NhaC family protein [Spirochaetales bacterium]
MDHFGILSILPPLLTIVLAIVTKDVIVSLFLGILSGALIVAGGNPFTAMLGLSDLIADTLADGWNIRIMLFTIFLGLLVGQLARTGAAYALGDWASKRIKSKLGALLFTWIFGLLIFFDDYFNSLTIGTCMRPLCDAKKVSRAKLAYILDSTAAPMAILAPVSTWVVYVMGTYKDMPEFQSLGMGELPFFVRTIPFNLYAIFALIMVAFISFTKLEFGPMARSEARAEKGLGLYDEKRYGVVVSQVESKAETNKAKPFDFLIPIVFLIAVALFFFPMTTWLGMVGSEDGQVATLGEAMRSMSVGEAFNNTDSSAALTYAAVFANVFAFIYFWIRRLFTIRAGGESLLDGFRAMVPAVSILTLAWALGSIIKSSPADGGVGLASYVSELVVGGGFPLWLLPVVVYLIACVISFASGTSWGTMGIMIPIAMPVAIALAQKAGLSPQATINAAALTVGVSMGGAVFGDHCSPISDTTVLSSTGAAVPHLEHVATQLPYAMATAGAVLVGTLAAALTWSPIVGLLVTAAAFVGIIFVANRLFGAKHYKLD